MPYAARQAYGLTPAVRGALAAACAYFVTAVTLSAGITTAILLTEWPFVHDYGHLIIFISCFASILWYPAAQLIAFRAPRHLWDAIGRLMLLNFILASMFLSAAAGMVLPSLMMFFVVVLFVFDYSRTRKGNASEAHGLKPSGE